MTTKTKFKRVAEDEELPEPWQRTHLTTCRDDHKYRIWVSRGPGDNLAPLVNYNPVDELGRVLARKAELEKEEARLKNDLHELGPGAYEGKLFRATVGQAGVQVRYDSKDLYDKLKLEGFHAFAAAHRHETPREGSVRVVAKIGKDVEGRRAA